MRAYLAQARAEVRLTLTQGESLLVTLGIPVLLLVLLDVVDVLPTGTSQPVTFLAPGILALAVMATGLVSLSIATGFERSYGVLKRLAATPLGRPGLMAAKITAIVAVELVQVVIVVVVGLALGWHPATDVGPAFAALILGTIAFSGLGLLLAGALRAELVLGLANGLYLVLLALGGMLFPVSRLPGALEAASKALPAAALSQALFHTVGVGGGVPLISWVVLVVWAIAAPVAATLAFRWE
ncbi:MAG: ABC transporter permease [Acidimicrobiales bacterium]